MACEPTCLRCHHYISVVRPGLGKATGPMAFRDWSLARASVSRAVLKNNNRPGRTYCLVLGNVPGQEPCLVDGINALLETKRGLIIAADGSDDIPGITGQRTALMTKTRATRRVLESLERNRLRIFYLLNHTGSSHRREMGHKNPNGKRLCYRYELHAVIETSR